MGTSITDFLSQILGENDLNTDYNQCKRYNNKYLNINELCERFEGKNTINWKLISPSHITMNELMKIKDIDYSSFF